MKNRKKLLTLSLLLTAPMLAISSFAINEAQVEVNADEQGVSGNVISNDQSNWIDSTAATFVGDSMQATSGSFNWQSKAISGNSIVDFTSNQTLELNAMGDWKWEY